MSGENRVTQIPQIERLALPKDYPTQDAMKSWRQNEHSYHPDMWDLQYVPYRYLSGMTNDDLRIRYRDLRQCPLSVVKRIKIADRRNVR